MKKTWASGAIELLNHAAEHTINNSAFDKRIAFISIDNCVEILIRSFLSLPKQFFSSSRPSRNELDNVNNSFTGLLDLLVKYASDKLGSISPDDIEHYHRIRNKLYHDGTGLSVDDQYLHAYFIIAKILLKQLFDVQYESIRESSNNNNSIGNIIETWNRIEELIKQIYTKYGIDKSFTYKYEDMMQRGIMSIDDIQDISEVRMSRNRIVHSNKVDLNYLEESVNKSKRLQSRLEEIL